MDGHGSPIETYVPAWRWGAYLGDDAFATGIDCCTASWSRPAPNTHPGMAKAAGNYINAALIKLEAQTNGYVEAVALGTDGMVSEGSGQNLFLVRDGELVTPPINGSNLQGLTRGCALQLAHEAGLTVRVEPIPRARREGSNCGAMSGREGREKA
jgi:branched-chain amino acid aminotransferase